ncbi:hypothetical protein K4F52_002191 [Lecanicillium sp. MT-2017a]|nr:hypothetical protein K4F52_002191 [Lecanicillium sp. MT-2017a]
MDSSQDDSQQSQDSFMTVTDEDRHEVLYFAYGPNLSTDRMRRRCPYSTPIGLGYLPGWRWIVSSRGCANIVPEDDDTPPSSDSQPITKDEERKQQQQHGVYGLIYLLPPRDEELLDASEDVPSSCDKMQCSAVWLRDSQGREVAGGAGEEVSVLVYVDEKNIEDVTGGEVRVEIMERLGREKEM